MLCTSLKTLTMVYTHPRRHSITEQSEPQITPTRRGGLTNEKKLNPVPPGVKSAETLELWFSCIGLNVDGCPSKNNSAVAMQVLRFTQKNRQLNVSSGRLPPPPFPSVRERTLPLFEITVPSTYGSENRFLPGFQQ